MNVLLDTNILVRHTARDDPRQPAVRDCLARLGAAGESLCICAQSIVEYWSMSTRPIAANGRGMEPSIVRTEVDDILRVFTLIPDPPDLLPLWLDLCTRLQVRGRQAFDARLVAFMSALGIDCLVTLNPIDFARYPGVRVEVPSVA